MAESLMDNGRWRVGDAAGSGGPWRPAGLRMGVASLEIWELDEFRSIELARIDEVTELGEPDGSRHVIEVRCGVELVEIELGEDLLEQLLDGVRATSTPPVVRRRSRHLVAVASLAVVVAAVGLTWPSGRGAATGGSAAERVVQSVSVPGTTVAPGSSHSLRSTTSTRPTTTTTATTTTTTPTTTAAPRPTTTTTTAPPPPPPPPIALVSAPLTGLPANPLDLFRSPIVSKIDASPQAMPQVGLDQADIVMEVRIEGGMNRYIAVWHSRQPEVIGPHRSARTTDPDLLAMFGHPLFAFSGANPGVVERLAATWWKTGVGPGEVGAAYFRDESRPWPHNLFAVSSVLRSRPSPLVVPSPLFWRRSPGTPGGGVPVRGMTTSAGSRSHFGWDPATGTWPRWVHDRPHVHPDGRPVAPTNVVVVETPYGVSAADANSPEALSVGWGRAWVLSDGHAVSGSWVRADRTQRYDLRDQTGQPMTLLPGTTWIVLADGPPVFEPA